jgi:hypothetical protein
MAGLDERDWEERARQDTYGWLAGNWREDVGASFGQHISIARTYKDLQLTNPIAPWQCLSACGRFGDAELLSQAQRTIWPGPSSAHHEGLGKPTRVPLLRRAEEIRRR